MKALLLDCAARTTRARPLQPMHSTRNWSRRVTRSSASLVRQSNVRACTGCFGCWTRTPGECVIADDARSIAERAIASDVVAVASPVSFGCYGSLAKSVLDRMICLVLPHFTMVDGEVHHKPRYRRYPAWIALGTLPAPSAEQAALFARLVERNSVNMYNPAHGSAVIADDRVGRHAARELCSGSRHPNGGDRMSRALLLIGSPKPGTSASAAFAEAVDTRLAARGLETRIARITPAFSATLRMGELLDAIAECDLVVLAFPIYVDSLPAPVLRAARELGNRGDCRRLVRRQRAQATRRARPVRLPGGLALRRRHRGLSPLRREDRRRVGRAPGVWDGSTI